MLSLYNNVELLGTSCILSFSVSSHRYLWIYYLKLQISHFHLHLSLGHADHLVFRSVTVKVWHPVLSLPRKYSIDRPGAVVLCCRGGRDYTDFSGYLGNCETLNTCVCVVLNTNIGQRPFSSTLLTVWPTLSRWKSRQSSLLMQCTACKSSRF